VRVSKDKTSAAILVHVEFKDGDGFACRGVGNLFIAVDTASGNKTKTFKLNDPEVNRELFDSVTRTYRIELPTSPNVKLVKVQATFNASDEEVLSSKKKTLVNNPRAPKEP